MIVFAQKNLIPSSEDVSPWNIVHFPWSSNIPNARRNNSSSAPWNDIPLTSSPLCNSYTVQTLPTNPFFTAHSYTSLANCSGFLQSIRHLVFWFGSSHSPCPDETKSDMTTCMSEGVRLRWMVEFWNRGHSCTTSVLIFRSVWYFNMSSLHWPNCFSLVDNTGCMVKKGGK